jgi:hypothetical protein
MTKTIEEIREGINEKIEKAIPNNWCDPLLTGEDRVIGDPPFSCQDIEQLLFAIKNKLIYGTDFLSIEVGGNVEEKCSDKFDSIGVRPRTLKDLIEEWLR